MNSLKNILFGFVLFSNITFISQLSAQTFTQTIRGKVMDADSKTLLPGANVIVLNLDTFIASVTDVDGKFRLEKIPVGRHAIKISFIGYEDVLLNNVIVSSGKEVVLNIEMHEKVYQSEEVKIVLEKDKTKANNDLITNSARNFQSEETDRYAGSRGDPSKMVANYAGVATGNDARNDIIVRGNSPLGVLWRLEGVDIPNPNHFSSMGATGGPVSMLNNNLLGNSDFLTGAFPAEYGNKVAAVFDLRLRNGNNERMEYTGQLGFNGLEAGIEGPISKKDGSSFLVNYRYSTLEVFNRLGINFGVSAIPKYQDFSFKLNLPTQNKGVFTLWGIGGISHIELLDSKRDSSDWSFTSKGEDLVFTTGMGAAGISHLYFFNNNLSGKFSLSVSGSEFKITIDTLSNKVDPFLVYKNKSLDEQYNINYILNNKINAHHLVKAGITYTGLLFDYNAYYYSRLEQRYFDQFKEKNNSGILQSFVHWQYRINDKISLNNGVHYQAFLLNNSQSIEPRSGLKWQMSEKGALSFSYGMHSQTQPLIYYFFQSHDTLNNTDVASNRNLQFTRSHHVIAGYDYLLAKDFRLKIESYYQYLYNVPVERNYLSSFSMLNLGNDLEGIPLVDSLENKGTGKNYGAEITLEKFFSKHYYFLSTLSFYESEYKGSDAIERHTAFSGGFVFNTLGGVEIPLGKGNKIIAMDAKATMAGGNRYIPINLAASQQQKEAVYIDSLAFSKKHKGYSKIDFKISFRTNQKKMTQTWFVSVENIFNKKNVLREVYDPLKGESVTEYQLGIFPYGGYRIEF